MTAALKIRTGKNQAVSWDLRNLVWTVSLSFYTRTVQLDNYERAILKVLCAIASQGFNSSRIKISEMIAACARISDCWMSASTYRRRLTELEKLGFIRRDGYRHGGFQSITFLEPLLSLTDGRKKVTPPTLTHKQLHRSERNPLRKNQKNVSSSDSLSSVFSSNLPPARACDRSVRTNGAPIDRGLSSDGKTAARKKERSKIKHKHHPLVYSVMIEAPLNYRHIITEIARREIENGVSQSGVDWRYWDQIWCEHGKTGRAYFAKKFIIPQLIDFVKNPISAKKIEQNKSFLDALAGKKEAGRGVAISDNDYQGTVEQSPTISAGSDSSNFAPRPAPGREDKPEQAETPDQSDKQRAILLEAISSAEKNGKHLGASVEFWKGRLHDYEQN